MQAGRNNVYRSGLPASIMSPASFYASSQQSALLLWRKKIKYLVFGSMHRMAWILHSYSNRHFFSLQRHSVAVAATYTAQGLRNHFQHSEEKPMKTAYAVRFVGFPVALTVLSFAIPAHADLTVSASDNATITTMGPRPGTNGKRFFNVEGYNSANTLFASFGVLDFQAPTGESILLADTLELSLVESNAQNTNAGALNFYLTSDTVTDIQPTTSPLKFQSGSLPDGLGTQLTPAYLLGSGTFNTTGNINNGQVDSFTFTLSGAEQTYLTNQINAGGDIRLIVTPGDPNVVATYAGFSNTTFNGPSLTVATTAVPEPSSILILLAGLSLLAAAVRAGRQQNHRQTGQQ
jgi:hypothetical protein